MVGINDIAAGLGLDYILENYSEIINNLQSDLPKAQIIIQSILPVGEKSEISNSKVVLLNGLIKDLSAKFNVEYIDIYSLMVNEKGFLSNEYTVDGIHINGLAYLNWVKYLRSRDLI